MFGFGRCRGCEGRDQEIAHLVGQLEKLNGMLERAHARVVEVADPGANARAAHAERRTEDAARPRRASVVLQPTAPGYPRVAPRETVEVDE